jgi:hypothetical protein
MRATASRSRARKTPLKVAQIDLEIESGRRKQKSTMTLQFLLRKSKKKEF